MNLFQKFQFQKYSYIGLCSRSESGSVIYCLRGSSTFLLVCQILEVSFYMDQEQRENVAKTLTAAQEENYHQLSREKVEMNDNQEELI